MQALIRVAKCFDRGCIHYIGVCKDEDGWEVNVCKAFPYPEGIPDSIAYGDDPHTEPLPDQKNDIVFEKEK